MKRRWIFLAILFVNILFTGATLPKEEDKVYVESDNTAELQAGSEIICSGKERSDRRCHIKNLFWNSKNGAFFVINTPKNSWVNLPEPKENRWSELLDETSLRDHNLFYFELGLEHPSFWNRFAGDKLEIRSYTDSIIPSIESSIIQGNKTRMTMVNEPTFIAKRFYPYNVMHSLHDDLLGYAETFQHWGLSKRADLRFIVYDHDFPNSHDQIYDWLGPKMQRIESLMGWPNWVPDNDMRREEFICFKDVYIGTSKELTWYQYGYTKPQGPLDDLKADGAKIRQHVADILSRLGIANWNMGKDLAIENNSDNQVIAVFSRKKNRLILNEDDLSAALQTEFSIPVKFIRMEDMSLTEIAKVLSKTVIAIGMHGALLTMAMFMPPGGILIEGYPFGVPAENYTPYHTMCNLPGMNLIYRAWSCSNRADIIGYPDRAADRGGIIHLSAEEQDKILTSTTIEPHLCCSNPYWLYRIYQDTKVDTKQVIQLIREATVESKSVKGLSKIDL